MPTAGRAGRERRSSRSTAPNVPSLITVKNTFGGVSSVRIPTVTALPLMSKRLGDELA
ncbi:hypothetical protein QCM80_10000 [Bradyrhizobium sp. SSUT112]|uniref:hypothetical protein n=1 Tax=Bradyrhizobium sp. SSUT112 TaxID=3040604 RepID=UPI002446B40C|nr:hypothetical protein [Bradyrhizobium sp. SSUT112]MDH2351001.1 hypothetical protein [Bradyrhizobium sp. SSUT112]